MSCAEPGCRASPWSEPCPVSSSGLPAVATGMRFPGPLRCARPGAQQRAGLLRSRHGAGASLPGPGSPPHAGVLPSPGPRGALPQSPAPPCGSLDSVLTIRHSCSCQLRSYFEFLIFWHLGALLTCETLSPAQGHLLPKKKSRKPAPVTQHRVPVPALQPGRRHASGWPVLTCLPSPQTRCGLEPSASRPKRVPCGSARMSPSLRKRCSPFFHWPGVSLLAGTSTPGVQMSPPVLSRPVGGSTLYKTTSPSPQGQPSRSRQLKVTETPHWAHVASQCWPLFSGQGQVPATLLISRPSSHGTFS